MNKVIQMGRLTADPELKKTTSGVYVCSFTLAVKRPGTEDKTDFPDYVAWRSTAELICKWLKKGSPVIVEGSLQTRLWEDKAGQKRKTVEIVVDNVFFVPKAKAEMNEHEPTAVEHGNSPAENATYFEEVDDEDLPF